MKFFAVFAAVVALAAAAPTTQWSLNDLSHAIQNPATPAAVLPYLEHALNTMMQALFDGQAVESIAIPTPVGLLPVDVIPSPAVVMPVPVIEEPVAPINPAPVAGTSPAVVADASGSPLVQIIVNIQSEAAAETPASVVEAEESPALIPSPVIVAPEVPEPVIIAPAPAPIVIPEPIVIAPAPAPIVIAPAPAPIVVPEPIVIAPAPAPIVIPEANPIDVIAVGHPEVNPIDLLQPVPVVAVGAQEGILV